MANVFVSHRSADTPAAERLATAIESAGHSVWLDKWRIGVGDSIVQEIQGGLAHADYVVVCYSSDDIMSPWMSREWMSALSRQLDSRGVRLLPCRLTGGDAPAILSDIKYVDLTTDWNTGVAELLAAIV